MSEAEQSGPSARMDRRLAIKWILAAGAGALLVDPWAFAGAPPAAGGDAPTGYGTDPSLTKPYKPGDYWPLTFSEAQRRDAAALCDAIIPADGPVPSASQVGVPDFIDEWISAPYPDPAKDRASVLPAQISPCPVLLLLKACEPSGRRGVVAWQGGCTQLPSRRASA